MSSFEFTTLTGLFLGAVDEFQKSDAFLFKSQGRYQGVSSEDALRQVAALAAALERLSVGGGDRLAILAENRFEWALTDFAVLGLGAVVVPIYPTLLEHDIEFILQDSASKGIVVSTDVQLQKVARVWPRLPKLKFVLSMDAPHSSRPGVLFWHQTLAEELNRTPDPVSLYRDKALAVKPQNTATLIYTSGTVGEPKGVILTHSNIVSNIRVCLPLFPLDRNDVGFSFLPLSHILQRMMDYYCFSRGVSIAYAESMEAMPHNLLETRPTIMAVVPRVLERIHDRVMDVVHKAHPARQRLFRWTVEVGRQCCPYWFEGRQPPMGLRAKHMVADKLVGAKVRSRMGGRMRFLISGAAPLSKELAEFFHAVGLPVYEGYGLTETSPVIAVNYPGHIKLGTVGPVIPGIEVKLSDENTDHEGQGGREILVRGPNVTPGYYRRDESNREAFTDGWFRTGDLGSLDAAGYLSITGREKNLFKTSGGKYVSPEKIENLFQGHPFVGQIMVIGAARRFVTALIVPNFRRLESHAQASGINFQSREELVAAPTVREFMREQIDQATARLAPHERIRQFALLTNDFTLASGEMTPSFKIKRYVVEERYRDMIDALYSAAGSRALSSPSR